MPLDAVQNFAVGTLGSAYTASSGSLVLTTGHGARFPDPASFGAYNVIVWEPSYVDPGEAYHAAKAQIFRVTAKTSDTLTVTAAQESTSDVNLVIGANVFMAPTKKMIDDLLNRANHTGSQAISTVTGLQTELDGKAASSHTHTKSQITDFAHTHPISEVTNLQTTLDGKAAASHTHPISEVTNLQTTLDGKAASSHTHTKSQITDFAHTHGTADLPAINPNNIAANPDFSQGDVEWTRETSWVIESDAGNAFRGSWVARRPATGAASGLRMAKKIRVKPGDAFFLSVMAKVSADFSAGGEVRLGMNFYDSSNALVTTVISSNVRSLLGTSYAEVTSMITVPSTATIASAEALIYPNSAVTVGTLWVGYYDVRAGLIGPAVAQGFGVNLIENAQIILGTEGWTYSAGSMGGTITLSKAVAPYSLLHEGSIKLTRAGTPSNSTYMDLFSNLYIHVAPGKRYELQALLHPKAMLSAAVKIAWYTSGGAYISEVGGNAVSAKAGNSELLSEYSLSSVVGLAPSTAAYARFFVRCTANNPADADPTLYAGRFMFALASDNQTIVSPFNAPMRPIGSDSIRDGAVTAAKIPNTSIVSDKISGAIAVAKGGTGATDAATARTNLVAAYKSTRVFNVQDYGAVGDGSINDTTAINNAITAALSLATGLNAEVYFPPGTYRITSALAFTIDDSDTANLVISGAGKAVSIIRQDTASANGFTVTLTGADGNAAQKHTVSFYDIALRANAATAYAIDISYSAIASSYHNSDGCRIRGVDILSPSSTAYWANGIRVNNAWQCGISQTHLCGRPVAIENLQGIGIEFTGMGTNNRFRDVFFNSWATGFKYERATDTTSMNSEGFVFENILMVPVKTGIDIKGNPTFQTAPFNVQDWNARWVAGRVAWVSITNSHIDCRSSNQYAIRLRYVSHFFISQNFCSCEPNYSILVELLGCYEGSVNNNHLTHATVQGESNCTILMSDKCTAVAIMGNIFRTNDVGDENNVYLADTNVRYNKIVYNTKLNQLTTDINGSLTNNTVIA